MDESKLKSYLDGTVNLPGYGVSVLNSRDVKLLKNNIKLFESGIYAKDSSNITIDDNIIRENNYGIKYGYGVFNTKIIKSTTTFTAVSIFINLDIKIIMFMTSITFEMLSFHIFYNCFI